MKITEDAIRMILPFCRYPEEWVRPLTQACEKFEINTPARLATFIAQVGHESSHLNKLEENLIYSPQRIVAVWPKHFESVEAALPYGRNPEKLANKVYADRMGNGAEKSGDGFLFRGRGLIQITGRENYEKIGKMLDLPSLTQRPDFLTDKRHAAMSAAAFWADKKLNEEADKLGTSKLKTVVKNITKRVNGGLHGLDERVTFTERALAVFDEGFDV